MNTIYGVYRILHPSRAFGESQTAFYGARRQKAKAEEDCQVLHNMTQGDYFTSPITGEPSDIEHLLVPGDRNATTS